MLKAAANIYLSLSKKRVHMTINEQRKTAFIFLPAGGQKPGMGTFLNEYGKEPFAVAGHFLGIDLKKICMESSAQSLNGAPNANVALYSQSYSTFELLVERGINPDVVVGYSVGEYAALCAAGVYGFDEGIKYLYGNSVKYQKAFSEGRYGMALAVGVDVTELSKACMAARKKGYKIYISNFNAPGYYLISGEKKAVPVVKDELGGHEGIIMTRVNVPSHSPIVRNIERETLPEIDAFFAKAKASQIPLISTVTGKFVNGLSDIKRNMQVHLSSPVQWEKAVKTMFEYGINTYIELGPSTGLYKLIAKMAKIQNKNIEVYTTTDKESLEEVFNIYCN